MTDRLLPFNATDFELALEQVMATRLQQLPLPMSTLWDAERCPDELLPWLAWALSTDNWDADWPVETQRNVIVANQLSHPIKGSVAALRQVLDALDVEFALEEWFEYDGEPYTFRLTTSVNENFFANRLLSRDLFLQLRRSIDPVKPVRSHYRIRATLDTESVLSLGKAAQFFSVLRLTLTPVYRLVAASTLALTGRVSAASVLNKPAAMNASNPPNLLTPLAPYSSSHAQVQTVLHCRFDDSRV